MSKLQVFFGGNPVWVLIRLIVVSIGIGIILNAIDIQPRDILTFAQRLIDDIYRSGFDFINGVRDYFLVGAAVVFPIWLLLRLVALSRGPRDDNKEA